MKKKFKSVLEKIKSGELKKTKQIGHVSYYLVEKTPYSFHFFAVYERNGKEVLSEFLYDLRYKKYFISRNGREVVFNVHNLDTIIPRETDAINDEFHSVKGIKEFFDMVSVEENKGMYKEMLEAVGAIGEERINMTSRALIRLITDFNKLELLYKAGINIKNMCYSVFRNLVEEASQRDVKKVHEVFNLSKAQLKFLLDFSRNDNEFVNCLIKAKYLTQKDMDKYRGFIQRIKELEKVYNMDRLTTFIPQSPLSCYLDVIYKRSIDMGNYGDYDFFSFVYTYNHPNPLKLIEYLLFECYVSQGLDYYSAFREYRDYYRMCTDLEYSNFDRYPRYLKTYHDIVAKNYSVVRDEIVNKKFSRATATYKHWEMDLGKQYTIVVPDEPTDLVYEGNRLNHCVASYVDRVADGGTRILFLREKEAKDEPLVTIEVRGDKVVQVRGQSNRLPTKEEKEAVALFAKKRKLIIRPNYM